MARVIKVILFLLFVVGVQLTINGNFAEEAPGEASVIAHTSYNQHTLDSVRLPHFPTAELGSIGHNLSPTVSSRVQRTQVGGAVFTLKDIAQVLAERKSMLFKHWRKVYDSHILISTIHPVSEYYVFALRRILI